MEKEYDAIIEMRLKVSADTKEMARERITNSPPYIAVFGGRGSVESIDKIKKIVSLRRNKKREERIEAKQKAKKRVEDDRWGQWY